MPPICGKTKVTIPEIWLESGVKRGARPGVPDPQRVVYVSLGFTIKSDHSVKIETETWEILDEE